MHSGSFFGGGLTPVNARANTIALDLSDIAFLVVEDNQFVRRLIFEILNCFGAKKIVQASTAEEALNVMQAQSPDIIFSDWVMPGSGGIQLLRRLRGESAKRVPIIIISGHATPDHVAEAMGEGADSYVVKPFSPKTLMDHLLKVISADEKITAYID